MKKLGFATLALTLLGYSGLKGASPAIPVDADLESRVKKIVSEMTLDDKVGQIGRHRYQ